MSSKQPAEAQVEPSPAPAGPAADPRKKTIPAIADPSVPELGGPSGPEPTRYGDWERGGRCTDF